MAAMDSKVRARNLGNIIIAAIVSDTLWYTCRATHSGVILHIDNLRQTGASWQGANIVWHFLAS